MYATKQFRSSSIHSVADRESVLERLSTIDPYGIYRDNDADDAGLPRLSAASAIRMLEQAQHDSTPGLWAYHAIRCK